MSVATKFPPDVYIPEQARPRTATVLPFRPRSHKNAPATCAAAGSLWQAAQRTEQIYPVRRAAPLGETIRSVAPLRLTRRGYVVVGVAVALLTSGLLWLAHLSAPAHPGTPVDAAAVTVHDGDSLWSIASRIAPQRDPRTVVDTLERVNHLTSPVLQPGQVLRTR